jgi:hypothetical protein
MNAIKDADDERPIVVAMSTTDKYPHARLMHSTKKARVRMQACLPQDLQAVLASFLPNNEIIKKQTPPKRGWVPLH